ncbi:MAG: hypothetical protein ACRD29_04010 [Acidimicrobiales bacterium]
MKTNTKSKLVIALLVGLGLVVSACGGDDGGPGVAAIDSSTTTTADGRSGQGSSTHAVTYSQCMRDNGVPGFPDPDSNGGLAIDAGTLGVSPDSAQYQAAAEACADLLPQLSDEDRAEQYEAGLEYAQCMRDEGITGFPDPPVPTDGPTTQRNSPGDGQDLGFDPESPVFQAAHDACKDLLPAGAQEPSLNTSEGG